MRTRPADNIAFDRYRPLYAIGRGGMGIVEVALEQGEDGSERICALKRLLPEGARDKRHTEMFLREARLAALLSHPNVVHGFAFGEVDGEFFLAMEYVEGEPLSRVLAALREKKERLPPALAAFVVAEICEGLHAVHDLKDDSGAPLNVVHRDVSPHNVMIAYEGGLKLLDFGVAKVESEVGLTRTGEVKGKTAYMSPEQAMGEAALDRRSDLYSLGAVLFECVSGRKMWEGTDMEVLRHLALDEPPKLGDVLSNAPAQLCALYMKLVSKGPADRPASAMDVATELRAFVHAHGEADSKAMRAVMNRLFSAEAARRKTELERALAASADTGISTDHGEIVASVQSRRDEKEKRSLPRTALVAAAIAAIAGVSILAMHARAQDGRVNHEAQTRDGRLEPAPASREIAQAPLNPAVTAIAASAPSSSSSTAHDEAEKMPNRAPLKSRDKPPTKAPSHLDVDPNPI